MFADRVRADRDPAAEPAVGAADQPAAPLVGAAGDRELRRELGVDGEQQALAGQRDRQHPDPRRARRPPCRRARRRRARRPARSRRSRAPRCRRAAAGASSSCVVAELGEPRGVGVERRRDASRASRRARAARARSARATSTRDETPSLRKMLRRCDSTVLSLRNSAAAISRFVLRSVDELGDLELALGQRRRRRSRRPSPARAARRARRACAARGASRRARAPSRTRRARPRPRAASAIACVALARGGERAALRGCARTPPGAARRSAAAASADAPAACGGLERLAGGEQHRRARAGGERGRQLQPEPRGVAPRRGARSASAASALPEPRARRARGSPSRSSARPASCARARPSPSSSRISRPRSTSPASNQRDAERPAGPAARVRDRAAGQARVDARALLAGGDRAVEVAGVVARPAELEQRPEELVRAGRQPRGLERASRSISIASARRPCISNG